MLSKKPLFLEILGLAEGPSKFFMAATIGFGFSLAVILSTIGLMDGFEESLKLSLREYRGDISVKSRWDKPLDNADTQRLQQVLKNSAIIGGLKTEGFIVTPHESRGVQIFQMGEKSELTKGLKNNEAAVGEELAKNFNLKIGDEFTILTSSNPKSGQIKFTQVIVGKFINHKIFQQDQRTIYLKLAPGDPVYNFFDIFPKKQQSFAEIKKSINDLEEVLGDRYTFSPYWDEFSGLLEAVGLEKKSIVIVLQVIVLVALFNVLAFFIFLRETRVKEIFLTYALGISRKKFALLWYNLAGAIWILSILSSLIIIGFFELMLAYFPFFKLPAEIYYFERLSLSLSLDSFLLVYGIGAFWLFLVVTIMMKKLRGSSIITGLREEFK